MQLNATRKFEHVLYQWVTGIKSWIRKKSPIRKKVLLPYNHVTVNPDVYTYVYSDDGLLCVVK